MTLSPPLLHRAVISGLFLLLSLAVSASAQTPTPAPDATAGADAPLVAALDADGRFSTLADALRQTGLAADLNPAAPVTLFAPTDAAFAALPEGLLASLSADALRGILLGHVVEGDVTAEAARDAAMATTAAGTPLAFTTDAAGMLTVNGATITPDALAVGGERVHAIGAVLLPPAPAGEPDDMDDSPNGDDASTDDATDDGA